MYNFSDGLWIHTHKKTLVYICITDDPSQDFLVKEIAATKVKKKSLQLKRTS